MQIFIGFGMSVTYYSQNIPRRESSRVSSGEKLQVISAPGLSSQNPFLRYNLAPRQSPLF